MLINQDKKPEQKNISTQTDFNTEQNSIIEIPKNEPKKTKNEHQEKQTKKSSPYSEEYFTFRTRKKKFQKKSRPQTVFIIEGDASDSEAEDNDDSKNKNENKTDNETKNDNDDYDRYPVIVRIFMMIGFLFQIIFLKASGLVNYVCSQITTLHQQAWHWMQQHETKSTAKQLTSNATTNNPSEDSDTSSETDSDGQTDDVDHLSWISFTNDHWDKYGIPARNSKKTFRLSDQTQRPHIQVRITPEAWTINALIDTGSKHNLISLELYHQIERNLKRNLDPQNTDLKLVSHTRNQIQILGQIELDLWIKDTKNCMRKFPKVDIIITNDATEEPRILLGTQFLSTFQCDLNFSQKNPNLTTYYSFEASSMTEDRKSREEQQNNTSKTLQDPQMNKQEETSKKIFVTSQEDITFQPNETKIVNLKTEDTDSLNGKLNGEKLCHFDINALNDKFEALCTFKENGTKTVLKNQSADAIKITSNMILGYIDLQDQYEHINMTPILDAILETTEEKYETTTDCFCQDRCSIIGHFHEGGLTDYSEINLLTIEGSLHTTKLFFYEQSTSQLFISKKAHWNEKEFMEVLTSMPPKVDIKVSLPNQELTLRQAYILRQMSKLARTSNRSVSLTKFNVNHCLKHQPWRVLTPTSLWVHVRFETRAANNEQTRSHIPSLLDPTNFNQVYHINHWGEKINLYTSHDEKLVIADLQINSVKQRYDNYIQHFIQTFLKHYLSSTFQTPTLILSTNHHLSHSNVVDILLKMARPTATANEISQLINKYQIKHQEIDIIQINKNQNVQEITTLTTKFHSNDILRNLDIIQEILDGKHDPLEATIQELPRLSNLKDIKNATHKIDDTQINEEWKKFHQYQQQLNRIKDAIPEEAFDNQSIMTNITKLTDLPSLIPQQYLAQEEDKNENKNEITNWREIYTFPDHLDTDDKGFLADLFDKYPDVISLSDKKLPKMNGIAADINLQPDAKPVISQGYPVPERLRSGLASMLQEAETAGIISKISNEHVQWVSPSFLVKRNREGKDSEESLPFNKRYRLVINYSRLNEMTVKAPTILPITPHEISRLQGYRYFSSIDLKSYYHSISLTDEGKLKSVFVANGTLYKPNVVLEGLCQAPLFSNIIAQRLKQNTGDIHLLFFDDHLLAENDKNQQKEHLRNFFENCRELGVQINLPKCTFFSTTVNFLGFTIKLDHEGTVSFHPQEQRFKIFNELPKPSNTAQLYRYLGLLNYIADFIPDFQFLTSPFYATLAERLKNKTTTPIDYDEIMNKAFELIKVKTQLIGPQVIPSTSLPLLLDTDANKYGGSAVLLAQINGKWQISSFFSKRFPESVVRSNSSLEKEILIILYACEKFKNLIYLNDNFRIRTDCRILMSLILQSSAPDNYSKPSRWVSKLRSFGQIKFVHHAERQKLAHCDYLANRFAKEEEIAHENEHLLQWSFKHMKKDQFKDISLKENNDYTLQQVSDTLFSNIEKVKSPETTEELITTKIEDHFPCKNCNTNEDEGQTPATVELQSISEEVANIQIEVLSQNMKKYTTSYFVNRQLNDPDIQKIIALMKISKQTPKHLSRYVLVNGIILCRKINKHKTDHVSNLGIVLPKTTMIRLTADLHNLTHCGERRLTKMLRRHYYHRDLAKISQSIATGCQVCQICNNNTRPSLPEGHLHQATTPGTYVYIDFIVMKKTSLHGKTCKYILTCVDIVSNFIMAFACANMEAVTVIKCLKTVVTMFPDLKMIISDNQTSLCKNEKVKQFLTSHNVEPRLTIPYSSQSNYAETANRLIRKTLRAYEQTFKKNWLYCFEHAINALNQTPHSTGPFQGISPFEIIFNKAPNNSDPFHHLRNTPRLIRRKLRLRNDIDKIRTQNHARIVKAKQDISEIKTGALVRLLDQTRTDKQTPYFLPDIFKVISRRGYELLLENTTNEKQKHRVHLKFVKLRRDISESILVRLRPEQRQLLGYERDMNHDELISTPYTAPSKSDKSSTTNSSTTSTNQKSNQHKKTTSKLKASNDSNIGPDDSISQTGSTADDQTQKLTQDQPQKKNVFKRIFSFLQNKSQIGSKTQKKLTSEAGPIFLEKEGSFRFGAFRPAEESTPQPELRRSKRIKNLTKIDYKLYDKTGKKNQD